MFRSICRNRQPLPSFPRLAFQGLHQLTRFQALVKKLANCRVEPRKTLSRDCCLSFESLAHGPKEARLIIPAGDS